MTSADAFKVLGCEAGASREAITRQYQEQYTELQVRLDNAPTPQLKRLYEDKLHDLAAAYETLKSLPRTEAVEIEVPLPSSPPPPKEWTNSIGMQFVLIPAGEFMMGSKDAADNAPLLPPIRRIVKLMMESKHAYDEERPVHCVRLTKPFYLGKYAVTQEQWQGVMGYNPSRFRGEPRRPIETFSWSDVQKFIYQLNAQLNAQEGGARYRLPTEAEWEYAARAGSTTAYSFGDDAGQLGAYAWYWDNAGYKTHPVGQKLSNAWGLHDMYGNVWELVQDWYSNKYYVQSLQYNPPGPYSGSDRVRRGGSWYNVAGRCRSVARSNAAPGSRYPNIGFRLLREA